MTCHIVWLLPLSVHHPLRPPCPNRVSTQLQVVQCSPGPYCTHHFIISASGALPYSCCPRFYADVIHGGTSELDEAAADNATRRRGKARPKAQSSGTSAVKVVNVVEAATPKGPPPLPSASRIFYALRTVQGPHPDEALIRIRLPDLAPLVLRAANSNLHVAFQTFVNDKGTALSRRLLFTFPVVFCPMLQFFLGILTGWMLPPLICLG